MASFKLTAKQQEANELLASDVTNPLLEGGARSGKTFLILRAMVIRALRVPGARQLVTRFRFNHCKTSVGRDTLPKVMELCFPNSPYKIDKTDWCFQFPVQNAKTGEIKTSEIWLGGLDDKERTEKILGQEYCGIFLNECSQIPYTSRMMAETRLAQNVGLPLKMYSDCNPPNKGHWLYTLYHKRLDPIAKQPLPNQGDYASIKLNPRDNSDNLQAEYIERLENLPARFKARFLEGEYAEDNPNALFSQENIDTYRILDGSDVPTMVRVIVAVDPSGADEDDNKNNDDIGIAVVGLGSDGNAYLLEDLTIKAGPATWGAVAVSAYERHKADAVVGEQNFGGAMVKYVIQTSRPGTPYKAVTASRGKVVRAEPISLLYEEGKVRHVGNFTDLEDELISFSTYGYTGPKSPNRADAAIWAITELFPASGYKQASEDEKAQVMARLGLGQYGVTTNNQATA